MPKTNIVASQCATAIITHIARDKDRLETIAEVLMTNGRSIKAHEAFYPILMSGWRQCRGSIALGDLQSKIFAMAEAICRRSLH